MSENVHLLHYTHPCPVKFLTHVLFTVVRLYRQNLRSTDNSKHLFNGVNHCSVLYKHTSFLRIACKQVSETACALHLNIFQQPTSGGYLVKGKREEAIKIHKILYNLKKILQYKTESFGLKRGTYHEELLKYSFFRSYFIVFCSVFLIKCSIDSTKLFRVLNQTSSSFSFGVNSISSRNCIRKCFGFSREIFSKERGEKT